MYQSLRHCPRRWEIHKNKKRQITLTKFIFKGVFIERGHKTDTHWANQNIIFDYLYRKHTWFDNSTSRDVWHLNWDLKDKEQVMQKPHHTQL